MKKFVCGVCGYVYEGDAAPEKCPVCGVGANNSTLLINLLLKNL